MMRRMWIALIAAGLSSACAETPASRPVESAAPATQPTTQAGTGAASQPASAPVIDADALKALVEKLPRDKVPAGAGRVVVLVDDSSSMAMTQPAGTTGSRTEELVKLLATHQADGKQDHAERILRISDGSPNQPASAAVGEPATQAVSREQRLAEIERCAEKIRKIAEEIEKLPVEHTDWLPKPPDTAGDLATQTATQPEQTPTTTQAASAPAVDPEVLKILDELEAAGRKFPAIRADVEHKTTNAELGLTEEHTGWVAYQAGGEKRPPKFRIHFETLRQNDGPKRRRRVDYAFDGKLLTEAKHTARIVTTYHVPKDQMVNPTRLGKGPFPVPFGQKADDVLEYFDVITRPPEKLDPKNTVYLELTTRKEHAKQLNFTQLRMWIDSKTYLPVKIESTDKNKNITTAAFANLRTNEKLEEKMFRPSYPGWQHHHEYLDK